MKIKLDIDQSKKFFSNPDTGGRDSQEHLPEFLQNYGAEWATPYFREIKNHLINTPSPVPIEPNMLYLYAMLTIPHPVRNGKKHFISFKDTPEEKESETIAYEYQRDSLFDRSTLSNVTLNSDAPVQIIELRIKYNRKDVPTKHLGYVLPELNTVVLCDLTHSSAGCRILKSVLENLVENNLLHRRDTSVDKKKKKEVKPKMPKISVTLGADPEFELLDHKGNVLTFRDSTTCPYKGIEVGSSATSRDKKVGLDGNRCQVEFRPDKANSPAELVKNMAILFREVDANAVFSAIGDHHPIGGHIHIGFGKRVNVTPQLIKLLDYFVGIPTMKMSGKARGGYNHPGNLENKSYGFEYRTPPAAVFAHPKMLFVTAKIVQNLVTRYLSGFEFNIADNRNETTQEELITQIGLTEQQAQYYMGYINDFRRTMDYSMNVAVAWNRTVAKNIKTSKAKKPAHAPKFILEIHDDWNEDVRSDLERRIREIKIENKENPISVTIYGLSGKRGRSVAGMAIPGFEQILHPNSENGNGRTVYLGLARPYRAGELSSADREIVTSTVVAFIERKIHEAL
jgi:hypothetical protein